MFGFQGCAEGPHILFCGVVACAVANIVSNFSVLPDAPFLVPWLEKGGSLGFFYQCQYLQVAGFFSSKSRISETKETSGKCLGHSLGPEVPS